MAARVLRVRDSANDDLRKGIATIQEEQKVRRPSHESAS